VATETQNPLIQEEFNGILRRLRFIQKVFDGELKVREAAKEVEYPTEFGDYRYLYNVLNGYACGLGYMIWQEIEAIKRQFRTTKVSVQWTDDKEGNFFEIIITSVCYDNTSGNPYFGKVCFNAHNINNDKTSFIVKIEDIKTLIVVS
jgi:hypothetical protein